MVHPVYKARSAYWLPRKATSNQNARPWMVPACEMTNESGISILCRSDSSAVWKFTEYFSVRDKQMRMSKVSYETQRKRLTIVIINKTKIYKKNHTNHYQKTCKTHLSAELKQHMQIKLCPKFMLKHKLNV